MRADIEDCFDVVGRTVREGASLPAVKMHHLAADETPPRWNNVRHREQATPGLGLAFGEGWDIDGHCRPSNLATRASARGECRAARSAMTTPNGAGDPIA